MARTLCENGGGMTVRPYPPPLNRPKRPKPAPVKAMIGILKCPKRTHFGYIENGMISALGVGFGHFGHFVGGVQGGEHAF